ncbi:hypothetical protein Krac_9632 [Ktedonobacter racemifer DSM 44963]|uniref:Uncharacterized protein n=1 Tax=Ktedonobacter racemifer DSM 44963 TaxID=485913 RepID=D6TCV3_KTERA|nr:hypothetical protein Krac_9632 [Ktedonobacter racemifer DSM 44963]
MPAYWSDFRSQQVPQIILLFSKSTNLQDIDGRSQMQSGLPRHIHANAHDWGQVLMFEGKIGQAFGSSNRGRRPPHSCLILTHILQSELEHRPFPLKRKAHQQRFQAHTGYQL